MQVTFRKRSSPSKEVVEIDDDLNQMTKSRTSSVHHRIAEIYVRLGRPDDAIRSYRRTFWWDEDRQDLRTQGTAHFNIEGLDYALLLAKSGKIVESKAMYYWVLRGMVGNNATPFPMLVVFEPDVEMAVWEDTSEKLITAIMMLRAGHSLEKEIRMQEVLTCEPGSIAAFVHAKVAYSDLSWLSVAHGLARTSDEREWIARYDILAATPKVERADMLLEIQRELGRIQVERREKSVVLQKAKQDMAQMHKRLAD